MRIVPDPEIFRETTRFRLSTIAARLRELAYLNPGVTIRLVDEAAGEEHVFREDGGIRAYVEELARGNSPCILRSPLPSRKEKPGSRLPSSSRKPRRRKSSPS